MIITNSCIGMESARKYTSVSMEAYSRTKSVTTLSAKDFIDSLNGALESVHEKESEDETISDKKNKDEADTLSGNADDSLEYLKGKFNEITTQKISRTNKLEEDLRSAIRYLCLNFLLMLILGKNGGNRLGKFGFGSDAMSETNDGFSLMGANAENSFEFTKVTDTLSCEYYEGEFEGTSFSAKGIVKTADGREIDFDIDMTMSRSFERFAKVSENYESFTMKLMDPLVINLDSCAADVSDQKFYFDIDSDGTMDELTTLGSSSGFLALDRNNDGTINNGSELFGTKSGDGFKDLAEFDEDGNGWIDEADEIFDKLKIFCINEDGTTSQYSLKDKGVGAICLGNKETEFSINNQENRVNAMVRKTGLFLYENGSAGTVQHVDLSVELGA